MITNKQQYEAVSIYDCGHLVGFDVFDKKTQYDVNNNDPIYIAIYNEIHG